MNPTPLPPLSQARSRAGGGAVVLALHVLGLLAALQLGAWQDRRPAAPAQAPLQLWLLAPPVPAAAPPMTPAASRRPAGSAAGAGAPRERPEPQAITLPSSLPPTEASPAADAAAAIPLPPAPAAGPAPLNLALPRAASAPWRERNPALDDPRSNSPRPTLESRIAAAMGGSDQITEFRLEDGSVRLRRGQACVVVRPNRAGTLDPFNGSAQQRPRLLDRC